MGDKSVLLTYVIWMFGGWAGLHHFYLGRDRHAFVWWCLIAGYGGIGWIQDIFKIPAYVREANYDIEYISKLTESMKKNKKPPFSLYKFIGQIVYGNLLAWVIYKAIPEEQVFGYSLRWLSILIPLGSAIGAHVVGNIGRDKGGFLLPVIAAYLPYYFYTFEDPQYYLSTVLAAVVFRYKVEWRRSPPKKRNICKRVLILGSCGIIYLLLWTSYLYFNMSITNEHGETIKFRECFTNLLRSPLWKEFIDSIGKLWYFYRVNGWSPLWNEILEKLDPLGERSALQVLELPSSATQEQITSKWRQLSRKWHPDKYRDPDEKLKAQNMFMEIQEAYDKISVINSKRKRKSFKSQLDTSTDRPNHNDNQYHQHEEF